MEKGIRLTLLILFISCSNLKDNISVSKKQNKTVIIKDTILSCPQNGICKIETIKNKSLLIRKDDLNGIYYQTEDNVMFSIIKFTYTKDTPKNVQDGNYIEEIVLQIQNDISELNLTDSELQNCKILFGKHCFCKGEAGYYNIEKGKLEFHKENNTNILKLEFQVNTTSQKITTINAVFK
ncbi:hypothetical protein [Flavobacterium sp. J27]|uniref:hypothetical protein n=1 Tax=Flavobacterium sp. J27 TaxID=2060419 RepID=UPI00102FDF8A|nr:hypothetical protein [Flavobacterium sp. J27]